MWVSTQHFLQLSVFIVPYHSIPSVSGNGEDLSYRMDLYPRIIMSKTINHSPDGSEKGIPPIFTSMTAASTDNDTVAQTTSPRRHHFKQSDAGPGMFQTPEGKTIRLISYESLGLSPTHMDPMSKALAKMEQDEWWNMDVPQNDIAFRLIVFLYGRGYYDEYSKQARVDMIKKLLEKANGNHRRLRAIAFSNPPSVLRAGTDDDENRFDTYFQMAYTSRLFFSKPRTHGGFPKEVYHRMQASRNCYLVAACMWLTIKLQRDNPELDDIFPLDDAHIGRRHVIETREKLEDRVILDKGADVVTLCQQIIGKDYAWKQVNCDFTNWRNKSLGQNSRKRMLNAQIKSNEVGLVTKFRTCENFIEESENNLEPNNFGFWKFDGNSIDCEGEFIRMDPDDNLESERERLSEIYSENIQRMKSLRAEYNGKMNELLNLSARDLDGGSQDAGNSVPQEPTISSSGTHAMVLLGMHTDSNGKEFYMLLNWCKSKPLILVSFEYMIACQCSVFFLGGRLDT